MLQSTLTAIPCVLTIGGLDPSGGAGLPADARACAAFGAHALGVTTAVIAQNTRGVQTWRAVSDAMLAAQLDNLLSDIAPQAIKIGMLPTVSQIEIVVEKLDALQDVPLVLDTVFAPSQGRRFVSAPAIEAIIKDVLPRCDFVTPNIHEAKQLCGHDLTDWNAVRDAAREIYDRFGARHVLLKGGHWNEEHESVDLFFDGSQLIELRAPRVAGYEVRGTGCLLASALAAQRAQTIAPLEAAQNAKIWLLEKIKTARAIGGGRRVAV